VLVFGGIGGQFSVRWEGKSVLKNVGPKETLRLLVIDYVYSKYMIDVYFACHNCINTETLIHVFNKQMESS